MIRVLLFLSLSYSAALCSPFDSYMGEYHDTAVYDTKEGTLNKQANQNRQIKCRVVCDKKIYKEQKISEAIDFYKKSKLYIFNKN